MKGPKGKPPKDYPYWAGMKAGEHGEAEKRVKADLLENITCIPILVHLSEMVDFLEFEKIETTLRVDKSIEHTRGYCEGLQLISAFLKRIVKERKENADGS